MDKKIKKNFEDFLDAIDRIEAKKKSLIEEFEEEAGDDLDEDGVV